ncbi:MFS general substrate transporter [Clavulina sp. PMI_390]|nr:MFS general substrate transporter [Clavulina sp. PMI_390]
MPPSATVSTNHEAESAEPESRPLLGAARGSGTKSASKARARKPTPLPITALLILALVKLAEPLNFTQAFPYVNQMIEDLGIAAPEDVGYYSGIVESCFAFVQLFTIYYWSSLSDRIGRKPVVMIGVSGAAISAACFGFSRSLWAMLLSRSIAGALTGNIAVINSMVSDMTDETNQGLAFPIMGMVWSIGSIIGPMIGGNLSNPMKKWPEIFKHLTIFQAYPYLLPCLISSSFSVLAVVLCGLFVEETLPSIVAEKKAALERKAQGLDHVTRSSPSHYGSTASSDIAASASASAPSGPIVAPPSSVASGSSPLSPKPAPAKEGTLLHLLSIPHVRAILISAFLFSWLGVGFDVVFTLYSYTRVDLGGMGRSPSQIGLALAVSGAVGAFSSLVIFPRIQRRFNNRSLYNVLACFWPIAYAMMPIGNLIARWAEGLPPNEGQAWMWVAIAMILTPMRAAMNLYPVQMIIIKASVDSSQLGALFGLQQTISSLARALAPASSSALLAFSVEYNILGGHFVWVVLASLGMLAIPICLRVKDVPAPNRLMVVEDEE